MSNILPDFIMKNCHLTAGAKLTYADIYSRCWRDGGAFISRKSLAGNTGQSVRTVQRHLNELEMVGLICRRKVDGNGESAECEGVLWIELSPLASSKAMSVS